MSNHTREIRIDVMAPDTQSFMLNRATAPTGLKVGGLQSEAFNGPARDQVVLFFIVTWQLIAPTAGEIVKDIAKDAAKKWLVEFVAQLKAKRIRIQGREPKDQAELERIVADEIEIGKND